VSSVFREYDKIKDAKRKLESEKKEYRRKAEISGQEVGIK